MTRQQAAMVAYLNRMSASQNPHVGQVVAHATGRRPIPHFSAQQLAYLQSQARLNQRPPTARPRPKVPRLGSPPRLLPPRPLSMPPPPLVQAVARAVPLVGQLIQGVNTAGELFSAGVNLLTGGDDARTIAERQTRTTAAAAAEDAMVAQLKADIAARLAATPSGEWSGAVTSPKLPYIGGGAGGSGDDDDDDGRRMER